jgi:hypothetical protein
MVDTRLHIPFFRVDTDSDLYSFLNNRAPNTEDIFGLIDCAALEKTIDNMYEVRNLLEGRGGDWRRAEREIERLTSIWQRFCGPPPGGGTPAPAPKPDPCPIKVHVPPVQPPDTYNHDAPTINWWPWLKWVTPFLIPWPGNPVYGFV